MKKIVIFIQTACAILFLSSCEDTVDDLKVSKTNPVVLSELAINSIELDPVNNNNPAVTFNWTLANYGQQTAVNYSLELSEDATFTNPIVTGTVNGNNAITLSVAELNAAVGNVGLPPFAWNTVYARIVSSVGTQSSLPVASNSISFNVYPYFNYPFMDYYLVGNATASNWNNNNNNYPLFREASNSKIYHYTGFFGAGEFKILETKGLWQPQWGTNDGTTIDVNPGTGSDPGTFPNNNAAIATPGYYTFTINYATNTFSFVAFDVSTLPNYSTMTVQGSAGATTAMNQSSFDSHIWYVNNLHLTPGGLQFLNNAGVVWGGSTSFSGTAIANGENIPVVVEDDYDVWYNDLTGEYILIPLNL